MRRRLAGGLLAVVVAGALGLTVVAGDGGQPGAGAGDRFLPGSARAGAGGGLNQAPEADCAQWQAGSPAQRSQAVRDIEGSFSRGGRGAVLPTDEAHAVFARACRHPYAAPFKLWKLYEKALAFQYAPPAGL